MTPTRKIIGLSVDPLVPGTLAAIIAGTLVFAANTVTAMPLVGQLDQHPERIVQKVECVRIGSTVYCPVGGGDNFGKPKKKKHPTGNDKWQYQKTPQDEWNYSGIHGVITKGTQPNNLPPVTLSKPVCCTAIFPDGKPGGDSCSRLSEGAAYEAAKMDRNASGQSPANITCSSRE